MKVDLDTLVVAANDRGGRTAMVFDVATLLTLIARVRELEGALGEACRMLCVPERNQDDDWYERQAALNAVIEKGATL